MVPADLLPTLTQSTTAQPANRTNPGAGLQTIEPLYVIQLPESPSLRSAIVSPDGSGIYALVHVPVIDIGKLLNQYTLAWTGTLAVILASVFAIWARRAANRRRQPGSLFCRRCDYDVTSQVDSAIRRCPECGTDLTLKKPLPGRTLRRRIALPVAFLATILGAYAWLAFFGVKRYPSIVPAGRWGSQTLQDWSSNKALAWLSRASGQGDLLLELDATTGLTRRVITTRATRTYWQMDINPSAGGVYLSAPGLGGVDLVDLGSGRTISRFARHPPYSGGTQAPVIVGHSPDFERVYLTGASRSDGRMFLSTWDWRSGATKDIASVEGFVRPDTPRAWARHYTMIPDLPRRFVQFPDFMEAYESKTFDVKLLDEAGRVTAERSLGSSISSHAVPVFSADSELMFLVRGYGESIEAYDTTSLEPVGEAKSVSGRSSVDRVIVRSDGRFMLAAGSYQTIDIRDLVEKKWVAQLRWSTGGYAPRSIAFSDDGRTVCAVLQAGRQGNTPGAFVFELGVWRLPESFAVGAPQPPAK